MSDMEWRFQKTAVVTIASGQATSTVADAGEGAVYGVAGIQTPSGWTAAALTFRGSFDSTTWWDIHNESGEYVVASANVPTTKSASIALPPATFAGIGYRYWQVRSNTAAGVINQTGAKSLCFILRPFG